MREKVTSTVFIAILAIFFALVMIFPKDEQASVQENRPLAEMPEITLSSIFSGEFGSEYETYLTDNVGFRSRLVNLGTKIENSRGIQKKAEGRIVDLANGSRLVLNDGKIMEVYRKNPETMAKYIDTLNAYSDAFSDKADIYLMLAPTQIEFDKSKYKELADSEKETIDTVYSYVRNIKTVNVYDKLKAHADEYIYFRTDHHWTQRGAYYGYQSIMETKGEKWVSLDKFRLVKKQGFLGYLYNQANVPEYSTYADDIECFEVKNNYAVNVKDKDLNGNPTSYTVNIYTYPTDDAAPSYGIFMGGDHSFAEINTENKNGEVALIIKDSYANTVIPLLTSNYEKILVIDPRSYEGTVGELLNKYEIDDIIFINYVLSTTLPGFIDNIAGVMK